MAYIVSHQAQSVDFVEYIKQNSGLQKAERVITINGGADVINKKTLETPRGVVTEVSDKDLAFLKTQYLFNLFVENGSLEIVEDEKKAQKKAKEKAKVKDKGAQLTAQDFKDAGKEPPVVGADSEPDKGFEN